MEQQYRFPDEVQKIFDYLCMVQGSEIDRVTAEGGNVKIRFCNARAADVTLILINANGAPSGDFDSYSFESDSLAKQCDKYVLSGEAIKNSFDTDNEVFSEQFEIEFTAAELEVSLYKAHEQVYVGTPWDYLHSVASSILNKQNLSVRYLNEKEKALLPLLNEINKLSYYYFSDDEKPTADFANLKSYAQKYDYSELILLFDRLESCYSDEKKRDKCIKKLTDKLNLQKYEPLWREIYTLIADSQSDYPSEPAALCPPEFLQAIRDEIESKLHKYGYAGTYPDFIKTGKQNGIHMVQSYDVDYIVGFEKNAANHIHCNQLVSGGKLTVEFMCGFERLCNNEPSDIYSSAFNCKGKKFFQCFVVDIDINSDADEQRQRVDKCTQIAVKKAELKKLTKDERTLTTGFAYSYLSLFISVFIVMGGFFGFFMTLGFMLIEVVFTAIVGQANQIPELFMRTPWWLIFVLCWVLFGGAMGVVQVIGKRK